MLFTTLFYLQLRFIILYYKKIIKITLFQEDYEIYPADRQQLSSG